MSLLPTDANLQNRLIVAACIVELVISFLSCLHTAGGANNPSTCRGRCLPDGSWQRPRVQHPFLCVDPGRLLRSTRCTFPLGIDTHCPVEFSSGFSAFPACRALDGCVFLLIIYAMVITIGRFLVSILSCRLSSADSRVTRPITQGNSLSHCTPHVFSVLVGVPPHSLRSNVIRPVYRGNEKSRHANRFRCSIKTCRLTSSVKIVCPPPAEPPPYRLACVVLGLSLLSRNLA